MLSSSLFILMNQRFFLTHPLENDSIYQTVVALHATLGTELYSVMMGDSGMAKNKIFLFWFYYISYQLMVVV